MKGKGKKIKPDYGFPDQLTAPGRQNGK